MVEPHRHVDGIHRVDGESVRRGLGVKPHAVEHRHQVRPLFLPQRAAKDALPGLELLFDQLAKRGNRSSHRSPRVIPHSSVGQQIRPLTDTLSLEGEGSGVRVMALAFPRAASAGRLHPG